MRVIFRADPGRSDSSAPSTLPAIGVSTIASSAGASPTHRRAFRRSAIEQTQQRIGALGLFKSVEIRAHDVDARPAAVPTLITLEERTPWHWNVGAGYAAGERLACRRSHQPSERVWLGGALRPAGPPVAHRAHGRSGVYAVRHLASRVVIVAAGEASGDRRAGIFRVVARRSGGRGLAMDAGPLEHRLVRGLAGRKRCRSGARSASGPAGWIAECVGCGCRPSPLDGDGGSGAHRRCCTSSRPADGCPAPSTTSALLGGAALSPRVRRSRDVRQPLADWVDRPDGR